MQLYGWVQFLLEFVWGSFIGFESKNSSNGFSFLSEVMCLVGLGAKFIGNRQCDA
jgi:hypothetical protein